MRADEDEQARSVWIITKNVLGAEPEGGMRPADFIQVRDESIKRMLGIEETGGARAGVMTDHVLAVEGIVSAFESLFSPIIEARNSSCAIKKDERLAQLHNISVRMFLRQKTGL